MTANGTPPPAPRSKNAETLARLRAAAIAAGRCYQCRARPVRPGARYCDDCFARQARYKASIAYVKCVHCGARLAGRTAKLRADCAARDAARDRVRREKDVAAGLCPRCRRRPIHGEATACVPCLDDTRDRKIAYDRERGVKPTRPCGICGALGHDRRTHDRYVARSAAWRTP